MSDIVDKSDIQDEDKRKIIECMRREEFRGPLPHPAIFIVAQLSRQKSKIFIMN